ncbi:glycoprotein-N-acetylgalactosamine 3-beta-galactosyltransferase 1-like [Physella acuta]|uniref:glycoprotein-N-acetylgalactosamine 3-beta-galactosyltransferase 1-like n=1 Tax=Physella acuta TaxID=109671 RepID=UPI0027DBB77B|nr:glycoprotein-N-acetylgalactosamine 3-beta-galactosyltransferase 1-like [Physella acuta]
MRPFLRPQRRVCDVMLARFKDLLLGLLIGLSMTVFFVGRTLVEDFPFFQVNTHTLTDKSPNFQPNGVVRMEIFKPTDQTADRTTHNGARTFLPYNDFEDDTIAQELSREVRVLVWVMTTPENLETKALAIKQTWGKRCNVIIYFSSKEDPEFPAVNLEVPEGRGHLTGKTMAAFRYIYEHYFDEADWFMKADDDTYVILENLRFFLSDKNKNEPIYFGHLFARNVEQGYYSGGGGYVISKEALRRFGKFAINSTVCREDGGDEDVEFGLCMERLNVKTSKSLDEMGRTMFHAMHPSLHILNKLPSWISRYSASGSSGQQGYGVSKYAVSFHYVPPDDMRLLDFYMYHLRPYGIHSIDRNNSKT